MTILPFRAFIEETPHGGERTVGGDVLKSNLPGQTAPKEAALGFSDPSMCEIRTVMRADN